MDDDPTTACKLVQPGFAEYFLAELDSSMTVGELLQLLRDGAAAPWLEATGPDELAAVDAATGRHLDSGSKMGLVPPGQSRTIVVQRHSHGAGPVELAAGVAAAKLALDGGRLAVDVYRARTERMTVQLEREKFSKENQNKVDC